MRKYIISLSIVSILFASVGGVKGILRTYDAATFGKKGWSFQITGSGIYHGADHMNDGIIQTWQNAIPRINIAYTPVKHFEFGISQGYYFSFPDLEHLNSTGDSVALHGLYDTELRFKLSYCTMKWPFKFAFGVMPEIALPILRSSNIPDSLGGTRNIGFGVNGLFSIKHQYFDIILNLGYYSKVDYLPIKVGLQGKFWYFKPYAELLVFGDKMYITPGLMIDINGFQIYYSQDLALNDNAKLLNYSGYNYYTGEASFGIGYATPEKWIKPVVKPIEVTLTAKDDKGNPLEGVRIVIKNRITGEHVKVVNTDTNGEVVVKLLPGEYTAIPSLQGYKATQKSFPVEKNKTVALNFKLTPIPVGIHLTVVDEKTGNPLKDVKVELPGYQGVTGDNGMVAFTLLPGTYTISLNKDGYIERKADIKVLPGKKLELKLSLVKKGMKLSFENILFETGSAKLLPESYPILDRVVRILKENPGIKMEIAGHTDSRGSAKSNQILSEKRAKSVKEYLVQKGISPDRLQTVGYGETKPIASNNTKEGRRKNRRVEFRVLNTK